MNTVPIVMPTIAVRHFNRKTAPSTKSNKTIKTLFHVGLPAIIQYNSAGNDIAKNMAVTLGLMHVPVTAKYGLSDGTILKNCKAHMSD